MVGAATPGAAVPLAAGNMPFNPRALCTGLLAGTMFGSMVSIVFLPDGLDGAIIWNQVVMMAVLIYLVLKTR